MKAVDIFCVVLLFAFASTINFNTCFAASKHQLPWTTWKVTILNYQINETLWAHCKSKDDDLGERFIGIGGEYSWEFKENLLQSTLFWCNFRSKLGHASFEVFWPEKGTWLSERCDYENCIWTAENKGFYLKNIPQNEFEFMHGWEPASS